MAKRECPFCKEKVKENAVICMHCKCELPPLPSIPRKRHTRWIVVLPLLIFVGWVLHVYVNPEQTEVKREAQQKAIYEEDFIRIIAQEYVVDHLKAPSTAKFPNRDSYKVYYVTDKKGQRIKDVWSVYGYVDSQNSFGAMIRQQWRVKMKKLSDKLLKESWKLLDIVFE